MQEAEEEAGHTGYEKLRGVCLCILFDLYALNKSRVCIVAISASMEEIFKCTETLCFALVGPVPTH